MEGRTRLAKSHFFNILYEGLESKDLCHRGQCGCNTCYTEKENQIILCVLVETKWKIKKNCLQKKGQKRYTQYYLHQL